MLATERIDGLGRKNKCIIRSGVGVNKLAINTHSYYMTHTDRWVSQVLVNLCNAFLRLGVISKDEWSFKPRMMGFLLTSSEAVLDSKPDVRLSYNPSTHSPTLWYQCKWDVRWKSTLRNEKIVISWIYRKSTDSMLTLHWLDHSTGSGEVTGMIGKTEARDDGIAAVLQA